MTNLSNINQLLSQLSEADKVAIIALIDLKVEDDMEKVLNKLDSMTEMFNAKFNALDSKFDAKFDALDSKFDAKFDALDHKISIIKWLLLSVISLVSLVLTIMRFLPQLLN